MSIGSDYPGSGGLPGVRLQINPDGGVDLPNNPDLGPIGDQSKIQQVFVAFDLEPDGRVVPSNVPPGPDDTYQNSLGDPY